MFEPPIQVVTRVEKTHRSFIYNGVYQVRSVFNETGGVEYTSTKSHSSLDRLVDLGENHTEGLQSNFHQEKTGSWSSRIEW